MRWPWESQNPPKDHKTHDESNAQYIVPAREEIQRAQQSLGRIDRILIEAQAAEALVRRRNQR